MAEILYGFVSNQKIHHGTEFSQIILGTEMYALQTRLQTNFTKIVREKAEILEGSASNQRSHIGLEFSQAIFGTELYALYKTHI